jgi:peptidoglycan/xylan/chitin deacetylase (PgdA/CDA1 family)
MTGAARVPVLMYHRVGRSRNDWESRYCISPQGFAGHMRELADRDMSPCTLEEFFSWLDGKRELPKGSFLLTFDDGFLGVYEHAAPVLRELGWPATVFLVSGLIGARDEWCRGRNPSGAAHPLLAPEHIAAMQDMGFCFHSHTRLHPDLTTLSDDDLAAELKDSCRELENLLGTRVTCLAYPYGRYDDRVLAAARAAGYQAAFSTQPGFNRRGVDPFRIRRLDVFGTDTPAMLFRKVFFGSNDGSWSQPLRYYANRVAQRLGLAA